MPSPDLFLSGLAACIRSQKGTAHLIESDGFVTLILRDGTRVLDAVSGITTQDAAPERLQGIHIGEQGELSVLLPFLRALPSDRWWPLELAVESHGSSTLVIRLEIASDEADARPLRPLLGIAHTDGQVSTDETADRPLEPAREVANAEREEEEEEEEEEETSINVGPFRVALIRQDRVERWTTASGKESNGVATFWEVYDDTGVDLVLADVAFDNGERDVRATESGESDARFDRLTHGLRLGVRVHDAGLTLDLGQARLTQVDQPKPWSSVFMATKDELDRGAGVDIEETLRGFGARAFGTRAEILHANDTRKNFLCATFPQGAHLLPVAAYVATRVAPLRNDVLAYRGDPVADEPVTVHDILDIEPVEIASLDGTDLYQWQLKALGAWHRNDHRGIVEAVTGSGKTRVAIEAIRDTLDLGARVMVVVPLTTLQEQWASQLHRHIPEARVAFLGGGGRGALLDCDVLIATIQSSHGAGIDGIGPNSLIVVDEVHRAGAEQFSNVLRTSFGRRLGLSATYARMDGAHETALLPYFDRVVYSYGYRQAIDEDVISPFKVALIGVQFSPGERALYDDHTREMVNAKNILVHRLGVPEEPFDRFMVEVSKLAATKDQALSRPARRFMYHFTRRRELLAKTRAKFEALSILAPAVEASTRTLVFTQTVAAAEQAARDLQQHGVKAGTIHGQQTPGVRKERLDAFTRGELQALAAPQVLDEGLDVPEADLAIVLAASKQRRQMVQRMGRVLRKKDDGRSARFAILFTEGTGEDPTTGAHEAFLDELLPVASAQRVFALRSDAPGEIVRFLRS